MNEYILDRIPLKLPAESLAKRLRIDSEGEDFERLKKLILEAQAAAVPRAMYKTAYIGERGRDFVTVDGVRFTSRIMVRNFEKIQRVFPYIVTCGKELDNWSEGFGDFIEKYWADCIKESALSIAVNNLNRHIKEKFAIPGMSSMNPGSLEDWPIEQQQQLFSLFGNVEEKIGVRLTGSFLMLPSKSVSGVYFPTETGFENCQLCSKQNCPGRRAPYDDEVAEELLK